MISLSGKDFGSNGISSVPTVIWGQALEGSLARSTLGGWTPKVELKEGLRRTFLYAEEHLTGAAVTEGLAR